MGAEQYYVAKVLCPQCHKIFEDTNEFQYGATQHQKYYKLGDRVEMLDGRYAGGWVRNRRLKYFEIGAWRTTCTECQSPAACPVVLLIKDDVIDSEFLWPLPSNEQRPFADGMISDYTKTEAVLLIEEFGFDLVVNTYRNLFFDARGAWKPAFADVNPRYDGPPVEPKNIQSLLALIEKHASDRMIASRNLDDASPAELIRMAQARFRSVRSPRVWIHLNALYGGTTDGTGRNILAQDVACPQCRREFASDIEFPYGKCRDQRYRVGDKIDWNGAGDVVEIRDPRLKYVGVMLPPCDSCRYEATGYVTVAGDVIESLFVFPKDIMDHMLSPEIPDWQRKAGLTSHADTFPHSFFILIREYGLEAVRSQIQELSHMPEFRRHLGELFELLAKDEAKHGGRRT